MDLVPYALPLFFLLMGIELVYGISKGRNTYRINDSIGSLFMGVLSTASKLVLIGVGGLVYHAIAQYFSLTRLDTGSAFTWIFAFVAYDFCYYWAHRLGHERQILWASHVAHHQSEEYNLTTALRQTSTGFLLGWIFYIPMFLLGVPAEVYVTVGSLNLIYQYWVHTEHIPKLGWYEWVFITPSNHRVHHAQNNIYVDKNYGGVFILWDRFFNTFQEEREDEPPVFGILGPLHTFSPFWANLHIYVGIAQDAWRASSWKDKLWVLFARTGWRPADVEQVYPREKADLSHFEKFDPPLGGWQKIYTLFQLVVVLAAGVTLMLIPSLGYLPNLVIVSSMLVTMVCTGRILDGRPSAGLDMVRVGLLVVVSILSWVAGVATVVLGLLLAYTAINLLLMPLLLRSGGFPLPLQAAPE